MDVATVQRKRTVILTSYKLSQIDAAIHAFGTYKTSLGKTKYITKRTKKSGIVYEVRINVDNKTTFLGSFKDPDTAYLHLLSKLDKSTQVQDLLSE